MKAPLVTSPGRLLAASLKGAWRNNAAPDADVLNEAELSQVVPLLVGSGGAPLGWWKLRHTRLRDSATALKLKEVYRYHTIQAAVSEEQIARAFTLLQEANIEAVLVKGHAAARLYEERGLRPYGDMDVCVAPAQFKDTARLFESVEAREFWVDLHAGTGEQCEPPFAELYARGETISVGAARVGVRVLAAEDHLRLLCLHLLRHGAWRPLWLCDVAAAVEGRAANFNWERVLGRNVRRARWVACALGLARELLGARLDGTPFESEASRRLPRWLVPEVLKSWATPYPARQAPMRYRAPMRSYLRRPSGVLGDLLNRWPNPIEATVRVGGSFNELPRWPFQVANCVTRAARFIEVVSHARMRQDVVPH